MSLSSKPLDIFQESDLRTLIQNQVIEGKSLDYKRDTIGNSDAEKKEFLADVSSFANASGGHMILGVEEEKGVPIRIKGLDLADVDAEKIRLDNMILHGVRPRIVPAYQIHTIRLADSSMTVIVIRVMKSLTLPHMVAFKETNKFYSRNSHGKYLLDVGEIRNLFLMSDAGLERIRNFRIERLSRIIAGETPVRMIEGAKIVLHVVPLSVSDPTNIFDLSTITSSSDLLWPLDTASADTRHNFDGYVVYRYPQEKGTYGYLQIFRNGSMEYVDSSILRDRWEDLTKIIPSVTFEVELLRGLDRATRLVAALMADFPVFIMVSLIGVRGFNMAVDRGRYHEAVPIKHGIDRDDLMVPEVILEKPGAGYPQVMKPIFDAIWNATGWERSMNYDENGSWIIGSKNFPSK